MTDAEKQTFLVNFAKYLDSLNVDKHVRFNKLLNIKECMKICIGWDKVALDSSFDPSCHIKHVFECNVFLPKEVN
jgi:hypothetical protein